MTRLKNPISVFLTVFCGFQGLDRMFDLYDLTETTTQMWASSKFPNEALLQRGHNLATSILDKGHDPSLAAAIRWNLFNLLLPGHDMLWRLMLFMAVRAFQDAELCAKLLKQFAENSSRADVVLSAYPRTLCLWRSTLQLYPPARTIKRTKGGQDYNVKLSEIQP